jgi:L-fuculose-phosphate aldolase
MLLGEVRAEVAAVCGQLAAAGLVVGTAGNVSARAGDLVAVTPSGLDYAALSAGLVGVHRLDGEPVEAPLAPSSELPLHLAVYAAAGRAGSGAPAGPVGAIVHTHSPAATAVSALVTEVPAIHYQVAAFGGPVAVAPYATYGTDELAANVVTALSGRSACLMANHGAVTTGPDLATALSRARALEWVCDVYLRAAAAGRPRLLPPEEIDVVVRKMAGYGQRAPRAGEDQDSR